MKTPNDGDLFCTICSRNNRWRDPVYCQQRELFSCYFSSIIITSDTATRLTNNAQRFKLPAEWTQTDLPMALLPLEFLIRHVGMVSRKLMELTNEVSAIEDIVINEEIKMEMSVHPERGVKALIKRLHICNLDVVKLRRRWQFQMTLANTIIELIRSHDSQTTEDYSGKSHYLPDTQEYRQLLSVASLQHKLSQSIEYDLDVLPTRVSNQFNAVSRFFHKNFRS